ncbi:MAG TPA: transaldolase [Patescibacteria group bacterium]|nr:transaldolase [Patescibacteria group bacterium]
MLTVNDNSTSNGHAGVRYTLGSLGVAAARGCEEDVARVAHLAVRLEDARFLQAAAKAIGTTDRFRDVIATFGTPANQTPAGFRVETSLMSDGLLLVDLVRDISYDRNGVRRPTAVVFSADTANPYEVAPIAPLLGNLTCNPGIVYDLFINNPKANVGHEFNTFEEVMTELGRILGPGCDVSVEIENPFEPDFGRILDALAPFEAILSPYRLVVKVPHMGPVNAKNVGQLLTGDGRLDAWYAAPSTEDAFRSHNLALKLREHGYRVNYTLMFEPYQTALALQARPYFINSFIRHRLTQSRRIAELLAFYRTSRDTSHLVKLREFLATIDHLSASAPIHDLVDVLHYAEDLVAYRQLDTAEGRDGLDGVRHNLRLLRQSGMADTRLIVCSMEGPANYPDLDKLTAEAEFSDIIDRLVITAEPNYLARFTSASHVVSYQRRFMAAAATAAVPVASA